ncbi:MAG: helicase HerA domain-containing protein, partial [Blastocatellia bacterium]
LESHKDRFEDPPTILGPIVNPDVARAIVEARLSSAYHRAGFKPRSPTWPFLPRFFASLVGAFPRQVLQKCAEHQKRCVAENKVIEIGAADSDSRVSQAKAADEKTHAARLGVWDTRFTVFNQTLDRPLPEPSLLGEEREDELGELILRVCELLLREANPPAGVDHLLDADFSGNKKFPSLHARVRTVFHDEGDREEHVCLRVLQKVHHQAYKARLSAAMTAAGIDRGLSFRKLIVIRTTPYPATPKMSELTNELKKRGGQLLGITAEGAGALKAIVNLARMKDTGFDEWLRLRRPVSSLPLFSGILSQNSFGESGTPSPTSPPGRGSEDSADVGGPVTTESTPRSDSLMDIQSDGREEPARATSLNTPSAPSQSHPPCEQTDSGGAILIGRRLAGGKPDGIVRLNPEALSRHTVIRAGSGGGKTVLLKRLVEEAALCGIPSILIDPANDLAQLADPWPSEPEFWIPGDAERARLYQAATEVVIWTPGRNSGRPLQLAPLPDLAGAAEEEDQLNIAVGMAVGALENYVAAGAGEKARMKRGVLAAALRYFAQHGGEGLDALIALLSDLPQDAGAGIK